MAEKRFCNVRVVRTTALNESGSDEPTAGVVRSCVGNTERSFPRKAFSITRFIVELFGGRTRLIGEPDFVRKTITALFTIQRGTGRSSVSVIGKR